MDAIGFLREQHRGIERLLDQLRAVGGGGVRAKHRLIAQLGDLVALHTAAEERIFYPGVNRASTEDLLLRLLEEHLSVKRVLADLLHIEEWLPPFAAKVEVLDEQVRGHFRNEEERLFPKVRMLIGSQELEAMARDMDRLVHELWPESPRFDVLAQTDSAAPLE